MGRRTSRCAASTTQAWVDSGRNARTATAEKGKVIFEAAVSGLLHVVDEWRNWPIADRSDQHTQPVQSQIRW